MVIYTYTYSTSLPLAVCDTRSIFKLSKSGLDLVFFFKKTGCQTKAKESNLPYYFPFMMREQK